MKYIVTLAFFISFIFAQNSQKLIIDAKNFEADDKKGVSIFTGNVKLKMGADKLNANKLEIYLNTGNSKNKKPLKYIATGEVSFDIQSNGKHYIGKGNKVIYNPNTQEYTVIGKGYIKEEVEQREIYAEKIFINQSTGAARVSGSDNKPVRFILNIDNSGKQ